MKETKRREASALLDAGLPQVEVAKVGICTAQYIAAAKMCGKGTDRKLGLGTHHQVSDHTFIENLVAWIMDNPKISLWQNSRKLRVSLDVLRQTVTNLSVPFPHILAAAMY